MHSRWTFPNYIPLYHCTGDIRFLKEKKKRHWRVGRTKNGNTNRNNLIVQNVTAGTIKELCWCIESLYSLPFSCHTETQGWQPRSISRSCLANHSFVPNCMHKPLPRQSALQLRFQGAERHRCLSTDWLNVYLKQTRFSRRLEIRKERENQSYIQKDIKKNVVYASEDVLRTKDEFGSWRK